MEDFLAEILAIVAEFLLEITGELLVSLLARGTGKLLKAILNVGPAATTIGIVLTGAATGMCSVVIFPHPLMHPTKMHGISLIVSPLLTGLVMSQVGRLLRQRGAKRIQIESFVFGFAFAFAMALVRFAFMM